MSWSWYSQLSDAFKRRVGRYLINRYLGPFLEEGILLNQLSVEGPITLKNVALNASNISGMLEESELPVEFVDGFVQELSLSVPWSNLLKDPCQFSIRGLTVALQANRGKGGTNPAQMSSTASIFQSMCESFSSIHMAEDCLKEENRPDDEDRSSGSYFSSRAPPSFSASTGGLLASALDSTTSASGSSSSSMPGVQILAEAIDSVVMRVRLEMIDTTIRLEYVPDLTEPRGLALEFKVAKISYAADTGEDLVGLESGGGLQPLLLEATKRLVLEGTRLFSYEFAFAAPGTGGSGGGNTRGVAPPGVSPLRSRNCSSSVASQVSEDDDDGGGEALVEDELATPNTTAQLQLAFATGRQELVVRFAGTNEFGLPRSVEEVELNVAGLFLHVYPHQIHIVSEIIGAVTATTTTTGSPPEADRHPATFGSDAKSGRIGLGEAHLRKPGGPSEGQLEILLHREMIAMQSGCGGGDILQMGGGNMLGYAGTQFHGTSSSAQLGCPSSSATGTEAGNIFHEISFAGSRGSSGAAAASAQGFGLGTANSAPKSPRIVIKVSSLVAVLIEQDEGVERLGGEATKAMAFEKMSSESSTFFSAFSSASFQFSAASYLRRNVDDRLKHLIWTLEQNKAMNSHLRVVATPLNVVYEETPLNFSSTMSARATVTIGHLSVDEVLRVMPGNGYPAQQVVHPLIAFKQGEGVRKELGESAPDLRITYKAITSAKDDSPMLSVAANPCLIDLDPGIYDRTYMLFNYSELDPFIIRHTTNQDAGPSIPASRPRGLNVNVTSSKVDLLFHVPKADMRKPRIEVSLDEFVSAFWSRSVHPEIYQLLLDQMDLSLSTRQGRQSSSKLSFTVSAKQIETKFKETSESETFTLLKVQSKGKMAVSQISLTMCLEEKSRLQGKYSTNTPQDDVVVLGDEDLFDSEKYFGSPPEEGLGCNQQQEDTNRIRLGRERTNIVGALKFGQKHNNFSIEIKLDEANVLLPNKHVYEVIYNRLGNDMLLWLPAIYRIKEHLYNIPMPDPLRDAVEDDRQFQECVSGTRHATVREGQVHHGPPVLMSILPPKLAHFPRSNSSRLTIHIDTFVSLNVNKLEVKIYSLQDNFVAGASSHLRDVKGDDFDSGSCCQFVAELDDFQLDTVVGLERSPEICLLGLRVKNADVWFGPMASKAGKAIDEGKHSGLSRLLQKTLFRKKAWKDPIEDGEPMLHLTSKILFDSSSNFKTIGLCLVLSETSLIHDVFVQRSEWMGWLADFFAVVEYPVQGYVPPAILTEMQFDFRHCSVDLASNFVGRGPPTASVLAFTFGEAKVFCSLQDTGRDATVKVTVDDVGHYLYPPISTNPTTATDDVYKSICVGDLDFLEVSVNLREGPLNRDILDVNISANQFRLRACTDTIKVYTDIANSLAAATSVVRQEDNNSGSSGPSKEGSVSHDSPPLPAGLSEVSENVIPDLADAMAELEEEEKIRRRRRRKMIKTRNVSQASAGKDIVDPEARGGLDPNKGLRKKKKAFGGAQVFFFPDEGAPRSPFSTGEFSSSSSSDDDYDDDEVDEEGIPKGLGMTESFYNMSTSTSDPLNRRRGRSFAKRDDEAALEDSFCIIDQAGTGKIPANAEFSVKLLDGGEALSGSGVVVVLRENHFAAPQAKSVDFLRAPKGFPPFQYRVTLRHQTVVVQLFGGRDFGSHPGGRPQQQQLVDISGDPKSEGGPGRRREEMIEVRLAKVSFQHEAYPAEATESSRQVVVVNSFEVRDRLKASAINKLLHLYSSRHRPRQSSANMFCLKSLNFRPEFDHQPEESIIRVTVQPLRVNIDQDTLFFMADFASSLAPETFSKVNDPRYQHPHGAKQLQLGPGQHLQQQSSVAVKFRSEKDQVLFGEGPPGDMLELAVEATEEEIALVGPMSCSSLADDLLAASEDTTTAEEVLEAASCRVDEAQQLEDVSTRQQLDQQPHHHHHHRHQRDQRRRPPNKELYIRSFTFTRDVPIRIDYSAKYMDLTQGALAGMLAGLTSLDCSELTLKRVHYTNGIVGITRLVSLLVNEWVEDIRQNQIAKLLRGVGPMHALLQFLQGLIDLFMMPVEQYQKDGRFVRGLQRGAQSFTSSTAVSFLDLANRALGAIKFTAELAYDIMSPEGAVVVGRVAHPVVNRRNLNIAKRPYDVREGLFSAFAIVQEGLDETARTLASAAAKEHARRGLSGALGGVIRQVPSALIKPVILATNATSNVLEGVKNQVDPDRRQEDEDKWKSEL